MDAKYSQKKNYRRYTRIIWKIYFSAFKNGKQTCDRYFLNYFLYLLMSLALYYYTTNEVNINLKGYLLSYLLEYWEVYSHFIW